MAYAREGADVVISYLSEDEDAKDTAQWVERAGRKAALIAGDVSSAEHCRAIVRQAVANFAASLAGMLGDRGIRVNSVAPGPIWTPLIPATMPEEKVKNFGKDTPLGRAGQPAELAPVYVLLASDEGSYISAARVAVTGGRPIL
jgi:NAD(P)-dependent dehydrogenase (short-subunit alcohol dehydrogenase family)